MTTVTEERSADSESSILLEAAALIRRNEGNCERGAVKVQGETIGYDLYALDARSNRQRDQDTRRGRPDGNVMVIVPGHGQSVHGPKKLVAAAALLSRSKLVWCIDPTPARGGDPAEAQAIASIVESRISDTFPEMEEPIAATLIGWSHGGGEALRAAECAPGLFRQYLGLCPTGLVNRQLLELTYGFLFEVMHILRTSVRRRDWTCLKDTLRIGWDIGAGLVRDLWRTKSPRRLIEDLGWAGTRVSGSHFRYSGEVVLLFGAQDTLVRWQHAFPEADRPQDIARFRAEYQKKNFPQVPCVNPAPSRLQ